jgi:hypothetical protein
LASWLVKPIRCISVKFASCMPSRVTTMRTLGPDGKNSTAIVLSYGFTPGRKSITWVMASRFFGSISAKVPRVSWEMGLPICFIAATCSGASAIMS